MSQEILDKVANKSYRKEPISVRVGDKVKVHIKIKEEKRDRTQIFEGYVMSVSKGSGINGTFTVRRMGKDGIAVEKIFKLHSEFLEKVEVVKSFKVRRSTLGYLRDKLGMIKLKELKGRLQGRSVTSRAQEEEKGVGVEKEPSEAKDEAPEEEKVEKKSEVEKTEEEKKEEPASKDEGETKTEESTEEEMGKKSE